MEIERGRERESGFEQERTMGKRRRQKVKEELKKR